MQTISTLICGILLSAVASGVMVQASPSQTCRENPAARCDITQDQINAEAAEQIPDLTELLAELLPPTPETVKIWRGIQVKVISFQHHKSSGSATGREPGLCQYGQQSEANPNADIVSEVRAALAGNPETTADNSYFGKDPQPRLG